MECERRMADIIKTWPAFMEPRKVLRIFNVHAPWGLYYFSLGRGKPQQPFEFIWFTYRSRILGRIEPVSLFQNDGSLPPLVSLQNQESEWQFKHDVWIVECFPSMDRLREHLYMPGFRGWRYFDIDEYRTRPEAKFNF